MISTSTKRNHHRMSSKIATSGSWADDEEDTDLGVPPAPAPAQEVINKLYSASVTAQPQQERPPAPKIVKLSSAVASKVPLARPPAPPQVFRESWVMHTTTTTVVHKVEFASMSGIGGKQTRSIGGGGRRGAKITSGEEVKATCSTKNCTERGYLTFTERHVTAQQKDIPQPLTEGVYCLKCVTEVAPRCRKEACEGKSTICLPGATYAFSLFCSACMAAHRAKLAKQE